MRYFVTGGAGFIGSHLVDRLIALGHSVVAYDNLSNGTEKFVQHHLSNPSFTLIKADLLDFNVLKEAMKDCEIVFHLAANSDIPKGAKNTRMDLEQGTLATYNVLESMRQTGTKKILFSSSNVVYGEAKKMPTTEDYGPLIPISLYAAGKLAAEALITAFSHNFDFECWIYRFGNIVGPRATHGILYDFYNKLKLNICELEVLGDGNQSKPYLEVNDCIDALLFGVAHGKEQVNIFNLGTEGATSVNTIIKIVLEGLDLNDVRVCYTGGKRGWPGDIHTVRLDSSKIISLGWQPKYSSNEALRTAFKAMLLEFNG